MSRTRVALLWVAACAAVCDCASTQDRPGKIDVDGSADVRSSRDMDAAAGSPADAPPIDAPRVDAPPIDTPSGDGSIEEAFGAPTADAGSVDTSTPEVSTEDAAADAADGGRDLSTDRTRFFGPSRCALAQVQLCEDFESGSIDKSTWSVSGTPPVVDGLEHARGTKALHITQVGSGLSYIKETRTFPEPRSTYYGRVFVFFRSLPPPAMGYAHWTFVAASGTGVSGEIRLSGQLARGSNLFGVGTDNRTDGGTGDWTHSDDDPHLAPVPPPLNQWLCIEWLHQGQTNETRFYWDGVEHPSLYTSATQHGGNTNRYVLPSFTNVWIGWQEYQPSTATFELWVDEIAIDTRRIGCVL